MGYIVITFGVISIIAGIHYIVEFMPNPVAILAAVCYFVFAIYVFWLGSKTIKEN